MISLGGGDTADRICVRATSLNGGSDFRVIATPESGWVEFEAAVASLMGGTPRIKWVRDGVEAPVITSQGSLDVFLKSCVDNRVNNSRFPYLIWTPEGTEPAIFDCSDTACNPFGFSHCDVVEHTAGAYQGEESVIIGVRDGELWYDTGTIHGALFSPGLRTKSDFITTLGWKLLKKKTTVRPLWDYSGSVIVSVTQPTKVDDDEKNEPRKGKVVEVGVGDQLHVDDILKKPKQPDAFRWRRGKLLGSGAHGSVYIAIDSQTGRQMAVKVIPYKEHDRSISDFEREITALSTLSHKNIVKYIRTDVSPRHINILMEYIPGGSLSDLCQQCGGKGLGINITQRFMKQVALAVEYLHSHNIVHRDIKPGNILTDAEGTVKLADFGASKQLRSDVQSQQKSGLRGTVLYLSPEAIRDHKYSTKSDIWAIGCTMLECLTGNPPWREAQFQLETVYQALITIAYTTKGPNIPSTIPESAQEYLEACLAIPPEERPSATSLLKFRFLEENFACERIDDSSDEDGMKDFDWGSTISTTVR
eukprot:TRINITY_DN14345_c0_g1_i3.p1 TRINITY_DN14345_c0_g1~~TRINITY_DN14345_c0_g1_i3.p1  ORF type:complete len:533 (+),score=75.98 TRINITY_DN14345_c0_g1_i3:37-1635(+)